MSFDEVWEHLQEDTRVPSGPGRAQRRIRPTGRRNFFLGLEMPGRHRMLILRVAASSLTGQPDTSDSRGLVVRIALREAEASEAEVALVLTDNEERDIFDLLIGDLVEAAERPVNEAEGLRKFLARLSDWQQLLRRLGPQGLSREGQQGLWGELWVLRDVVAPVTGLCHAIRGWRGPMGADQDFQLDHLSLEVKTSTAATLDRLEIASERQLEVPADVSLLLVAVSLDARPGHGETLPDIVKALRSDASEVGCLRVLDARLELTGYQNEHAAAYEDVGYEVRSFAPFRVEEGFPRIVSGDLRTGVGDVHYSVSAAASSGFRVEHQEPHRLIRDLV